MKMAKIAQITPLCIAVLHILCSASSMQILWNARSNLPGRNEIIVDDGSLWSIENAGGFQTRYYSFTFCHGLSIKYTTKLD